jgi:hypothetical protein
MNTNPRGNTIITDACETTDEANGEFERFEAVLGGLVQVPKKDADDEKPEPSKSGQ